MLQNSSAVAGEFVDKGCLTPLIRAHRRSVLQAYTQSPCDLGGTPLGQAKRAAATPAPPHADPVQPPPAPTPTGVIAAHPPDASRWLTVAEAAAMTDGALMTFARGRAGLAPLWLRHLLHAKQIPVALAAHPAGPESGGPAEGHDELYRLTAQRSTPVLWWERERPLSAWTEQVYLAERVGKGPRLIPADASERREMLGFLHEVMEGMSMGFLYYLRLMLVKARAGSGSPFARKYGYTAEGEAAAPAAVGAFLSAVDCRLEQQARRGSEWLFGRAVSAADIIWATIALPFAPDAGQVQLTQEGEGLVAVWHAAFDGVAAERMTDRLRAHRRRVLGAFTEAPTDLGGTPLRRPSHENDLKP